jgi:hypothetical protein
MERKRRGLRTKDREVGIQATKMKDSKEERTK